jgi:anti-sigma regulatory factor (Ser/Thr protein kinase)
MLLDRKPTSGGFEVVLRDGVDAPWLARRAIASDDAPLPRSVQDDLSLLVTELVTNAVRHGGAATERPVKVTFRQRADRVRVEVVDPGTDFEPPSQPTAGDSSGGWGLFLVDRIAEHWGVRPAPTGTCVWFEMQAGAAPNSV